MKIKAINNPKTTTHTKAFPLNGAAPRINFDYSRGLLDRLRKARLFNEGSSLLFTC